MNRLSVINKVLFVAVMSAFGQFDGQKNAQRLRCWANTYFRRRKYVGGYFICGSLTTSLTIINKYPACLEINVNMSHFYKSSI